MNMKKDNENCRPLNLVYSFHALHRWWSINVYPNLLSYAIAFTLHACT